MQLEFVKDIYGKEEEKKEKDKEEEEQQHSVTRIIRLQLQYTPTTWTLSIAGAASHVNITMCLDLLWEYRKVIEQKTWQAHVLRLTH